MMYPLPHLILKRNLRENILGYQKEYTSMSVYVYTYLYTYELRKVVCSLS